MSNLAQKIDQFLEYLQVDRGSSPLTIRNYKHYLTRLEKYLNAKNANANLSSITQNTLHDFRVHLVEMKLGRRTQSYHMIALRSFLKWLIKNDELVLSPEKIDLPKLTERKIEFLSGEEVDRLLSAPSLSTIQGKRDKAILEVLFSTGLRVSELTKLDKDKIDIDRREFGITGKGGRTRVVFLSSRSVDWLVKYLNERNDHFKPLFIRHKGHIDPTLSDDEVRLTPRSVQRMVKKYSRKVKLPIDAHPHLIRHSYATDLLNAGADIRSVQEMLGHKNISTTQVYTHVTNKQLREIHETFHGRGGK